MSLEATTTETHELDAIAVGLEPDQEIRSRALACAVDHVAWTAQPSSPSALLDLADTLATYIRDGSKP